MKKVLWLWLFVIFIARVVLAGTYTTNYSLYKPAADETGWGTSVNTNFDTIDTQLKTNADAIAAAGTGDVSGVGNCTGGDCLDGSSDGGSAIKLYDTNSHYTTITPSDVTANTTVTLPSTTGTLVLTASPNFTTSISLGGTALTSGNYLDGTKIADADLGDISIASGVWSLDVTASTAWDDIGDPDADATIAFAGYKQTISSTLNTAGAVMTFTNTTADLTSDVSFIDYKLTDDGDSNGYYQRGYDNAGADLKWYIGPDGAVDFGTAVVDSMVAGANDGISITGANGSVTFLGLGDGEDEDLKLDFNSTANTVSLSSTTSMATIDTGSIGFNFEDAVLEVPNAAAPTVDAAGELAVDTTDDQLVYYGGAKRVVTYKHRDCKTIEDITSSDDNVPIFSHDDAVTITNIRCWTEGGTSAEITLSDGTNDMDTITCDADGQSDDGSIANSTLTALEQMEFDTGTVTGTVDWVNICWSYTVTAE